MAGFRKRTRASAPRRNVRRKFRRTRRVARFGRRRATNSVGRVAAWTSQSGTAHTLGFRRRRTSASAFRRIIYRDTAAKAHYRSNGGDSVDLLTPISSATVSINFRNAFVLDGGRFWTVAGGTFPIDTGVAVPTFQDDIILRGGKIGLSMWNNSTVGPIYAEVFLIRDSQRPSAAALPATAPVGWDPTILEEFNDNIGRIVMRKKMVINQSEVGTVEYRLKPMKIDQVNWLAPVGSQLSWLTIVTDYSGTIAQTIRLTTFHNVSFSADVSNPGV